jgi:(4S)-4-hydroxy-5-phosphonooxypentane-2,3-dione isomerase
MITFVVYMRVLPENAQAYEAAFTAMRDKVLANEPGAIHYALSKSAEDPTRYMAIEVYRDEAALEAHADTDYLKSSIAITTPLVVAEGYDCKRYEGV